jgi:hypothetical protein
VRHAEQAFTHAARWLEVASAQSEEVVEAGARRFALTLGRALSLALMARQAQWSLEIEDDERALAAAVRFDHHGVNLIAADDVDLSRALALD